MQPEYNTNTRWWLKVSVMFFRDILRFKMKHDPTCNYTVVISCYTTIT